MKKTLAELAKMEFDSHNSVSFKMKMLKCEGGLTRAMFDDGSAGVFDNGKFHVAELEEDNKEELCRRVEEHLLGESGE